MDRFPECGKPIDDDRGAGLAIDASMVPENLAHLVSFVNKWSFATLHDQDVFVARMKRSRKEEIDQLNSAFNHKTHADIRDWAAAIGYPKHVDEMTAEDWAHPIFQFLNILKLRETTGGFENTLPLKTRLPMPTSRVEMANTPSTLKFSRNLTTC